jgi:20S proteasome subunit beta 7
MIPECPVKLTCRQPLVTGTSVLGIKYKDGVMLAADNLGKLSVSFREDS